MFRFTLRDMLWLTALIALAVTWWVEQRKLAAVTQERDEAVELWHDAAAKWVAATSKIPRDPGSSFLITPKTPQPAATGGDRRRPAAAWAAQS